MTTALAVILTVISTMVAALGSIAFKKSATHLTFNIKPLMKNYGLMIGFLLFGLSALIYIYALTLGELNVLYPISAFTYVWGLFIGKYFFYENLNIYKYSGMLLVLIGAFLIINS